MIELTVTVGPALNMGTWISGAARPKSVNPSIKELARRPRGKPWASRLCPHEEEIRRRRKAHQPYREIALWLGKEKGLAISAASVHAFVRARARRRQRPQYELPEPSGVNAISVPGVTSQMATDRAEAFSPPAATTHQPPVVFVPKPPRVKKLTSEDLAAMDKLDEP